MTPEGNIKKYLFLIVMCRQMGYVWMKLLLLQYRFGKIRDIVSDRGTNLRPKNINPSIIVDNEEKHLMSLIHTQTPTGGQHENVVESRIKMIKQYCQNIIGKVKGERFKPISLTQSEFIMASTINEVKNNPSFAMKGMYS